ncbi:MAG: hypothetical protein LBF24_02065 [Puniceicoccales bacterium]|nr:hypothetical protein [Puniceicoccales bacterium]
MAPAHGSTGFSSSAVPTSPGRRPKGAPTALPLAIGVAEELRLQNAASALNTLMYCLRDKSYVYLRARIA